MAQEQEQTRESLKAIHVDFQERSITFEAENSAATKLTLAPGGVLYELLGAVSITARSVEKLLETAAAASPEAEDTPETDKTIILAGRLKSQPKEGKPDRSGNPTAWARFAAHQEDNPEARMLLLTFHRATARIALSLAQGDPVTVQGYLHPANDPEAKRLDTFSAFSLLHYPGKKNKL